jgi:CheY-like chemotaxis protein
MDKRVVLIAEDEPLVLLDIEDALGAAGFEVVSAINGTEPYRFLTRILLGS